MLINSVTEKFVAVIEDGRDLSIGSNMKSYVNKSQQAYLWKKAFRGWMHELKSTLSDIKTFDETGT